MTVKNPLIEPEDFFAGYQRSLEEARAKPEVIEFDQLCFAVFGQTEDGRALLEMFKERFIMCATPCALNGPYETACVYYEGYRDAFRMLIASVRSFKQRKDADAENIKLQGGV